MIVGYGDIGKGFARQAKHHYNMHIIGIRRDPERSVELELENADEIVSFDRYDEMIRKADIVCGILPKVKAGEEGETEKFFNLESTFSKMKPNAVFIDLNVGSIMNCRTVDDEDLREALIRNEIDTGFGWSLLKMILMGSFDFHPIVDGL